jgi:hypothetical protein
MTDAELNQYVTDQVGTRVFPPCVYGVYGYCGISLSGDLRCALSWDIQEKIAQNMDMIQVKLCPRLMELAEAEIENGLLRYNMKYHIIGSSDWEF